ncbi:MAG: glycosyltransferase [Clostridia bacterium]|nr:glycosyltransferase [Clostridia bacterium]
MKVCDVVLNSVWYDPRVRKQIVEYKNNGVDVVCVGFKDSRFDEKKVSDVPCDVVITELDEKYRKPRNKIQVLLKEFNCVKKFRTAIIEQKPDVIHANDLNTLTASCQAAKKLGCKVVYDSHEICVENNFMKGIYKKLNALCEKVFIKRINKMVCVSHAASDYFVRKYDIEPPMVITNCSLKAEKVISCEKNDGFEILNHGQYYAGRGYDIIVEAAQLLTEYPQIKIAMRGFGAMEESLRKRADEIGGENIIFYPPVLVNELIPYASKSMVGVAITENTCLNFELSVSNKIFEYASAGLPVIMSDIPEHRYLNDKYNFGIILKENTPKCFAEAAIKLYTDKDFYNMCAKNAEKLSEEVNWETEFARLIEIERSWVNG